MMPTGTHYYSDDDFVYEIDEGDDVYSKKDIAKLKKDAEKLAKVKNEFKEKLAKANEPKEALDVTSAKTLIKLYDLKTKAKDEKIAKQTIKQGPMVIPKRSSNEPILILFDKKANEFFVRYSYGAVGGLDSVIKLLTPTVAIELINKLEAQK